MALVWLLPVHAKVDAGELLGGLLQIVAEPQPAPGTPAAPAQKKKAMLHNPKHLILEAPHPSPLSAYRGFFGCKHFSKTNEFLMRNKLLPIDWQIEDI